MEQRTYVSISTIPYIPFFLRKCECRGPSPRKRGWTGQEASDRSLSSRGGMNEDKNILENWTREKIITSENLKIGYIEQDF